MLNTHKLLYILPDVAYIAELLPGKQAHSFQVQSFRQINGKFLDDNEFIPENVMKLAAKVNEGEYTVILPDFLFTNTIINIKESSEVKVKAHLKGKLLPDLKLDLKTHEVETSILTEHKGTFKVQIAAIEKSVLVPVKQAEKENKFKIKDIYSLSWTIKSVISLEPSISIIQMGDRLYLSQHYIGVDQSREVGVGEASSLVETVKTLKGAEPSIQTIYLISSELIEDKLKDTLSKIVPIQQLADFKDTDSKMPSYVKRIIESGMKTVSIPDYQVPKFVLTKVSLEGVAKIEVDKSKDEVKEIEDVKEKDAAKEKIDSDLPKPSVVGATAAAAATSATGAAVVSGKKLDLSADGDIESTTKDEKADDDTADKVDKVAATSIETSTIESVDEKKEEDGDQATEVKTEETTVKETKDETAATDISSIAASTDTTESETAQKAEIDTPTKEETSKETSMPKTDATKSDSETKEASEAETSKVAAKTTDASSKTDSDDEIPGFDEIDLKQFVDEDEGVDKKDSDGKKDKEKEVIKNKPESKNMLKMLFIFLVSFSVTVAIGVGIGLGILKMTNQGGDDVSSPVVETVEEGVSPTPEVTATPTPEPEAEIDKEVVKILVVNATTKSGYAGTIKKKLDDAEFASVKAGNAKGDYDEEGVYLLMEEESAAWLKAMEDATELEVEYLAKKDTEDSGGDYDAVLVLAK